MFDSQTSTAVITHRWLRAGKVVAMCGMAVADTKSGEGHFLYPAAPAAGFLPINVWS